MSTLFMNVVFTMFFLPLNHLNTVNKQVPEVIKSELISEKNQTKQLKKANEGDGYYVRVSRAYFYTQPSQEYINTKKFLIRGDYCEVLRYRNGFGYVNYYNTNNYKTTSGWLDLNNLSSAYDH